MSNRKSLEAQAARCGFSLLERQLPQNPPKQCQSRWSLVPEDMSEEMYFHTLGEVEIALNNFCNDWLDKLISEINFKSFVVEWLHEDYFMSAHGMISIDSYLKTWNDDALFKFAFEAVPNTVGIDCAKDMRRVMSREQYEHILSDARDGLMELPPHIQKTLDNLAEEEAKWGKMNTDE